MVLTLNIESYVTGAVMTFNASKSRYQYFEEIEVDLDGLEATITDEDGECDRSPIH